MRVSSVTLPPVEGVTRWMARAALAICLVFFPSVAEAQRRSVRVVTIPFSGPGAEAQRERVQDAIAEVDGVDVVAIRRADSAASRVDADSENVGRVGEIAEELEAQLIVGGQVRGRGARRSVELQVYGANGRPIGDSERVPLRPGRSGDRAVAEAVAQMLERAMADLPSGSGPRVEEEEAPPPAVRTGRGADEDEQPERPGESGPPAAGVHPEYGVAPYVLVGHLGLVIRSRNVDIELNDGPHRRLDIGAYPEIGGRLEFRPLINDRGMGRGLFIAAEFLHEIGLGVRDDQDQSVDPTFFRGNLRLGFLVPVGDLFEIGPDFAFGYDVYNLTENSILPSAEYAYMRPAARARLRVWQERIAIDMGIGYRAILGRGDMSGYFGSSGSSLGMDLHLGIGGAFDFGMAYGVDLDWVQYWHNFEGTVNADGVPGRRGTDGSYRIGLWVGFALR